MFDSGIAASELIADLKKEIDISIDIPNKTYITWLNSLEQLFYSEFIKEQARFPVAPGATLPLALPTGVMFEDIKQVYVDGVEHTLSNLNGVYGLTQIYYKDHINNVEKIGIFPSEYSVSIDIIHILRPAKKAVDGSDVVGTGNVMLPYEFIELVKAKLRGEAYKLANEDSIAAKWLNDYNILLENFKQWIDSKQSRFGI